MAGIDEQIHEAMRRGDFANLPGEGKPLKLDDDAHTPEHLRMAFKLLRDNDLVPDWMAQGQELDAAREALLNEVRRVARDSEALREAVRKHNAQVLSYNLKVPPGVTHKRHFDLERELGKLRG